MANLELEGKITVKLSPQSGQSARGQWARQDFVIEYMDGSFPTSACFSAWGEDKVRELDRFKVGDSVKVSFNVRGREYNGRWYNDLRIWKITSNNPNQAPTSGAPAPSIDDMPPTVDIPEEDLPF
jgi:hypothetical protein